jgi:hypothetical protein
MDTFSYIPLFDDVHDPMVRLEIHARVCLGMHESLEIISKLNIVCDEYNQEIRVFDKDYDWDLREKYSNIRRMSPWS